MWSSTLKETCMCTTTLKVVKKKFRSYQLSNTDDSYLILLSSSNPFLLFTLGNKQWALWRTIPCGHGMWKISTLTPLSLPSGPMAARYICLSSVLWLCVCTVWLSKHQLFSLPFSASLTHHSHSFQRNLPSTLHLVSSRVKSITATICSVFLETSLLSLGSLACGTWNRYLYDSS